MVKFVDALGELKVLGDRDGLNFGSHMTCVTGGGAHKYRQLFEQIGVTLQPRDEMDALVGGFRYMMNNYSRLSYTAATAKVRTAPSDGDPNTFVLANIGSGVSILLCTPTECTRVTGSSIGGSTFLGLVRRMTGYASFDDAVAGAASGDRTSTSMLVSDIYGSDYDKLGLAGSLVASDFGKLATAKDPKAAALDADIARGAMVLVLNNVAQLAVMTAQKHGASRIFFVGGMLRPGLMEELVTTGVEFWSAGKEAAHFLKHTGYLGTLGSLLANRALSKELMLNIGAK